MDLVAWIQWGALRKFLTGKDHNLTLDDKALAVEILKKRNVIILTYSKHHLSSYASRLGHVLLTGEKATYSHALLNIEPNGVDFELIEAINKGVVISKFDDVFNCDGFCILVPKRYLQTTFDGAVWDFKSEIGKGYDKLLNLFDSESRTCIELVFSKLKSFHNWKKKMPILDYMISEEKNLTPQLIRDCPDFKVLLEIKR